MNPEPGVQPRLGAERGGGEFDANQIGPCSVGLAVICYIQSLLGRAVLFGLCCLCRNEEEIHVDL